MARGLGMSGSSLGETPRPGQGSATPVGCTTPSHAPYLDEFATIQCRDPRYPPARTSEPTDRCLLETRRSNMQWSTGTWALSPARILC